ADPAYDADCHNVVFVERVDVTKSVTSGPDLVGPGQYAIGYAVTVTNTGAADAGYDLADELAYGDGLTVESATVVNTVPGGIPVNPAWDGALDSNIVVGVPIAGALGATPTQHTYAVTVIVNVAADTP